MQAPPLAVGAVLTIVIAEGYHWVFQFESQEVIGFVEVEGSLPNIGIKRGEDESRLRVRIHCFIEP